MPVGYAHADTLTGTGRDPVRRLYTHLTKDGVDAWLDKENPVVSRVEPSS